MGGSSPSRTRKGGVGQTTTAVKPCGQLGGRREARLLIGLGPQGQRPRAGGWVWMARQAEALAYPVLFGESDHREVSGGTELPYLDVVPAAARPRRVRESSMATAGVNARPACAYALVEPCPRSVRLRRVDCPPFARHPHPQTRLAAADVVLVADAGRVLRLEGLSEPRRARWSAYRGTLNPRSRSRRAAHDLRRAQQPLDPIRGPNASTLRVLRTIIPGNVRLGRRPRSGRARDPV